MLAGTSCEICGDAKPSSHNSLTGPLVVAHWRPSGYVCRDNEGARPHAYFNG